MLKKIILVQMFFLSGCTFLHHHQISEVDSQVVREGRRFEVLISETGVNIQEAVGIAKNLGNHSKTNKDIGKAGDIIGLFQMGPRTGNQVYTDAFSDSLVDQVLSRCPHGRISGLSFTRESAKYPVVSGEIVKVIGYCYDKGA